MLRESSTKRLLLTLLSEDDHDFILSLLNTEGWIQFIGNRNVHSKDDAVAYIRKIKTTPDLFYWVVRLKEAKTPVGIVSFLKRSYLDYFDLGFAFLPPFNGLGYAGEAAEKILALAGEKGYDPVLATTVPQNSRSISLLEKLGFHFEKELQVEGQTIHVYSRSAKNYRPKPVTSGGDKTKEAD